MDRSDWIDSQPSHEYFEPSQNYVHGVKILAEPIDVIGKIGAYVNFSAKAEANNPRYQWYDKTGSQIPRMCKGNLTIGPITEQDFGYYRLEVRDASNNTVLTRWAELKQPQAKVVHSEVMQVQPSSLSMTMPTTQQPPMPFQRTLPPQPQSLQEAYYPQQQQQPQPPKLVTNLEGGAYYQGSRITLTAHFQNATHYQWYKDGTRLDGCIWNTLIISNANIGNSGCYTVFAYSDVGSSFTAANVFILH